MRDILSKIETAISELAKNEIEIIANNISERALTHKLAEYLQIEFDDYNVDCEYNRNYENGHNAPKSINIINDEIEKLLNFHGWTRANIIEFSEQISTYPDIIVHKRLTNENNLLVLEVKKDNNRADWNIDHIKLQNFTKQRNQGGYGFRLGIHLTIHICDEWEEPEILFYQNGEIVDNPE